MIINTTSTIMASFRPECKHFANNTCKFGSNCRDSHTAKTPGVVLASSTTTTITERVIMASPGVSFKSPKLAVVKPAIAAATEPPAVKCVLCFNTAGSMFAYLESARKELVATANKLVAKAAKHGHASKGTCEYGAKGDKPHAMPAAKPAPAYRAKEEGLPCKKGAVRPFLKAGTCTFKH